MPTRYTLVCDDETSQTVRELAQEFELTEEEVLRQLVNLGLDARDEQTPVR
jgi:predicted ArsR family transcriptional regulator